MNADERLKFYTEHGYCPLPHSHLPKPVQQAIESIPDFELLLKHCFYNCQRLFVENIRLGLGLDLEYHEGFAQAVIPLEHAWLMYEGEVLELTLQPDRQVAPRYLESIVYSYEDILQNMTETGMWRALTRPEEFWNIHPNREDFEALRKMNEAREEG